MVNMKLGRVRSPEHKINKCLNLAKYIDLSALPVVPDNLDWIKNLPSTYDFGSMLNNEIGDCGLAAPAHKIQIDTLVATGNMVTISDSDVLKAYKDVSGYNPNDPSTDVGVNMVDTCNYLKSTGIGGHKIVGYATFDPTNEALFQSALYLFGSLYLGFSLPVSAQDQSSAGGTWSIVSNDGGLWGGHAVALCANSIAASTPDSSKRIGKLITWGFIQNITESFKNKYCDEAHVLFTQDWLNNNKNIAGFDYNTLASDLGLIGS